MLRPVTSLIAIALVAGCTAQGISAADSPVARAKVQNLATGTVYFDRMTDAQILTLVNVANSRDDRHEKSARIDSLSARYSR